MIGGTGLDNAADHQWPGRVDSPWVAKWWSSCFRKHKEHLRSLNNHHVLASFPAMQTRADGRYSEQDIYSHRSYSKSLQAN